MENTVIISIGSNINASVNISRMISLLRQYVHITGMSPLLQTKAIGDINQPDFTNGALRVTTQLDREQLRDILKKIEDALGRDRSGPAFGPRTMDLDIVVWNDKIVDDDYHTRDFLRNSVDALMKNQGS
ncbi:MAG TPA: 2-amino-4-hydroxy-6-hydroxymethyldihydropteridine diphosphokinase [Prolixibacteraceae bacterium]|nr:2-amino-4-hydroxy-6-hydroxymethyldihydropteridine diphosphokinase [Prolixibacteraceae bacterium]